MAFFLRPGARCAAAATILVAFVAPRSAHAFCRTTTVPVPASYSPTKGCFTEGLPLYWRGACVSYSVVRAASARITLAEATPLIDQAFTTWTSAACSGGAVGIAASATDPVDCSEVKYNQNGPNQNMIAFRDTSWPYSDPNNTLGLTTVTFNADTGEIYDADMEINASGKNLTVGDPVPANGYDLLSVVTHEAGHFLGLAHATSATSTMFASYKPGTTSLRSLTADDVAGLCSIYPSSSERNVSTVVDPSGTLASTACDPTPRHGFGTTCAENPAPSQDKGCTITPKSTSASPMMALAGILSGILVRRRLRR
jgi:hypothetical protein